MFDNLRRDRTTYQGEWYRRGGFWIMTIYRFGNWADSIPSVLLRLPMWLLYVCLNVMLRIFSHNVHLWAGRHGARIGPGLRLFHPANVMICRGSEIGEDCQIYHEVTLGTGEIPDAPKIGKRVTIYPGARILGGVAVGDGSVIGANCVVTRDVPPNSTVLAAPSRAIPNSLSPQVRRWDDTREPLQPLSKRPPPSVS